MEKEIWKDIAGYEGFYMISNLGRVKSLKRFFLRRGHKISVKEKILKLHLCANNGYLIIILRKNCEPRTFTVHRLVCLAFMENPNINLDVNHINGIKTDNRLCNLEMITRSENLKHKYRVLKQAHPFKGKTNTSVSKKVVQLDRKTLEPIREFLSMRDAERILKLPNGAGRNISCVCSGKQKSAYGYKWKLA
jgi:hypothetical protein